MKPEDFSSNAPGRLVSVISPRGDSGHSFVANLLPPEIDLTPEVLRLLGMANFALGTLNGVASGLMNPMLFAQPFVRQEAVASTRIEGTRTDLRQLMLFELDFESEKEDVDNQETLNYVKALATGWEQAEIAVSTRYGLLSLHKQVMDTVRGSQKRPGEFRKVPAYIGGSGSSIRNARFVPSPPEFLPELMDNLLEAANNTYGIPHLVYLAVLHYQFETIHPFEDGNGRTGRLLLPLYLKHWGLLNYPLLHLSTYFERHRRRYIQLLYEVSTEGKWDEWIVFVLEGIQAQSDDVVDKARHIHVLQEQLRQKYQKARSPHILPIIEATLSSVATTVDELEKTTAAKRSTIYNLLRSLEEDGVLTRVSLSKGRIAWVLAPLLNILLDEPADYP